MGRKAANVSESRMQIVIRAASDKNEWQFDGKRLVSCRHMCIREIDIVHGHSSPW